MRFETDISLAALLDDVRPLIVAARDRGELPRYVMLGQQMYDAVARAAFCDRDRGRAPIVLGLEAVRSDEPVANPRVF